MSRTACLILSPLIVAASALAQPPLSLLTEGKTIRANSWLVIREKPAHEGHPVEARIIDPWQQTIWSGSSRGSDITLLARDWADGAYRLELSTGRQFDFTVDTAYFESVRARAALMLQTIDEQRDPDGRAPEPVRGVANLLQRVMTEYLWIQPPQRVLEHLIFCERHLGFRTQAVPARIIGSGAADFDGYESPYKPFQRERSMMFIPPDAVFDFGSNARRRLKRWGYEPRHVEHVFVTHSHADHFDTPEIIAWAHTRAAENLAPLHVYAGHSACSELQKALGPQDTSRIVIHELAPGREVQAGSLRVLPVAATHDPRATPLCFIARWRGATLYYGTDTAYPRADTLDVLKRERFTLFAHELTACSGEDQKDHTDIGDFHLLTGLLREAGAIRRHTRVVSIHQSRQGPWWMPDYNYFQSVIGFECSWDGMPLPIAYRVEDKATDAAP